jgi:hypothetical protein
MRASLLIVSQSARRAIFFPAARRVGRADMTLSADIISVTSVDIVDVFGAIALCPYSSP